MGQAIDNRDRASGRWPRMMLTRRFGPASWTLVEKEAKLPDRVLGMCRRTTG